jgi:DnaJ-class molecular chaperone
MPSFELPRNLYLCEYSDINICPNLKTMTHYKTLDISEDATDVEIKKAFRKLSLQYHPDRNKSPDAQSKFQEINEAYETLSDPQKKKQYDMGGSDIPFGFPGGFPGGFPFGGGGIRVHHGGGMPSDINDIFEHLFAGSMGGSMGGPNIRVFHNGRPVQQKPPPVKKTIPISLDQAYQGFNISMAMENGTEKEEIPVTVPKGINNNETIILTGKGNINGELRGDLHLIFEIKPHDLFTRDGLDLSCKKTITLKESLCGFLVEIPHLSGKMLRLTNQNLGNIVKPGLKREVPGFGMTKGDQTGKLILEFDITFPDSITEEQKDALKNILV